MQTSCAMTSLLIALAGGFLAAMLIMMDGNSKPRGYQATVNAIEATNHRVETRIAATATAKSYTMTPSPTA